MDKHVTDPAAFYGASYTPERKDALDKACRMFDIAINSMNDGLANRALNNACEAEKAALAA